MDTIDPTPPLPPEEHAKPVQPGTNLNIGHGVYVDDPDGQDAIWADAVTPDSPEFDEICAQCECHPATPHTHEEDHP